ARAEAVAWLTALRGAADWNAALDVLGEAPMLAARTEPLEVAQTAAEAHATLDALASGAGDPVAAAERWARAELPLRLRCCENWLTEHIRRRERDGAFLTEVRAAPYLPAGDAFLNIRELFGLLNLMGEDEKLPVAGRVIWVTPKGAQGNQGKRTAGIGVQFSEQDRGQTQKKIETYLAGALSGDKATHTM